MLPSLPEADQWRGLVFRHVGKQPCSWLPGRTDWADLSPSTAFLVLPSLPYRLYG